MWIIDSMLKNREILPANVHLVKAMVFPVVMYGCESWTTKKAEGQRIDAFELWCWRRLLRVPWTARRSNQSLLEEWFEAESPILWPPDAKSWLIWKDPDTEKAWRWEEKGMTKDEMIGWHHWLSGHKSEQTQGDSEGQGSLAYCSSWGCRVRHDLATEQQRRLLLAYGLMKIKGGQMQCDGSE